MAENRNFKDLLDQLKSSSATEQNQIDLLDRFRTSESSEQFLIDLTNTFAAPLKKEQHLEVLLASFCAPLKNIPFETFVKAWFGQIVIKFDAKKNENLLRNLKKLGRSTCRKTINSPIAANRVNEAGNKIEEVVKDAADDLNLDIRSLSGSGYPDLQLSFEEKITYIEVKTYGQGKKNQTFRSFYLSPSKKPKVKEHGHHLVLAFEIEEIQSRRFQTKIFHIIDCHGLPCNLKYEANTSNAVLYSRERVIYKGNV